MTRDKLIDCLNRVFDKDELYLISSESVNLETDNVFIKKWSDKLNSYSSIAKCFTYAGKLKSGWKSGDNIIWYIIIYINGDNKDFLIPDVEAGFLAESITMDFLKIFKNRLEEFIKVNNIYQEKMNSIIKLRNIENIQSEIREFKLNDIGIKNEKQE